MAQDASSFEAQSGRLHRAVFGGITRLTNKVSNLQAQLAAQLKAEHTRHLADLLTANLHLCRQGDASIEVASYPLLAVTNFNPSQLRRWLSCRWNAPQDCPFS